MRTDVDLSILRGNATVAVERTANADERAHLRKLWLQTWTPMVVTTAIALGLGLAYLLPYLEPVTPVQLGQILVKLDAKGAPATGAVQASGWIEPRPFATDVYPLVEGVVASLPVLEGTRVVKGKTLIATLDTTLIDSELAVARAALADAVAAEADAQVRLDTADARLKQNLDGRLMEALLRHQHAEISRDIEIAKARVAAARDSLRLNVAARMKLATEEASLAMRRAEREKMAAELASLQAQLGWLERDAEAKKQMADRSAVSQLAADEARATFDVARATVRGLEGQLRQLDALIAAQQAVVEAARVDVESPVALTREVREADAQLAGLADVMTAHIAHHKVAVDNLEHPVTLQAGVDEARAALAMRKAATASQRAKLADLQLRRELHTILAPTDGEVLRLLAKTGATVGPAMPDEEGALVEIFVPGELQVRVDMPLADVPAVEVNQQVEVVSETAPGKKYRGRVLRLTRYANVARNTLEVKVQIDDADDALRPEMLVRCRFLPLARPQAASNEPQVERWFVPATAVVNGKSLFVYDPQGALRGEGRAMEIAVAVVPDSLDEGRVEVAGQLSRTWKVILNPVGLVNGSRVRAASLEGSP